MACFEAGPHYRAHGFHFWRGVHLSSDFSRIYILAEFSTSAMIHLFLDASAASSGSGPTYVRNVVPHLAARTDLRSTILVSPLLRQEFRDHSNVSFVEFADESTSAVTRFARAQRSVPELVRRSGANV